MRSRSLVVLILLLPGSDSLFTARPVQAQQASVAGLIRGRLLDARVQLPVTNATIRLVEENERVLQIVATDERGRFELRVQRPGTYRVRAGRIGYADQESEPIVLAAGDTVDLELLIMPAPLPVDSILVRSTRDARPLRRGEQLLFGRLLDDATGDPIALGSIRLLQRDGSPVATVLTNDQGRFHLVSPRPGTYRLEGERIGYRTARSSELHLMLGDTIGFDFHLSTEAVLLEPITVTASARPWWDRAEMSSLNDFVRRYVQFSKAGFGEFMTRDSIARFEDRAMTTGHMLLSTIAAVREVNSRSGQVSLDGGCRPRYYLNGARVPYEFVAPLPPADLEAVEVYVQPTIPAELNSGFPCGVIAYWTRVSPRQRPLRRTVWTGLGVGAALALILFLVR